MSEAVRIGCWSGFWGDTPFALGQLLREDELDYLVADYLAEITMALLARRSKRGRGAGYVEEVVAALRPHLAEIQARRIKVVTNAGGLDPAGCAAALEGLAGELGVPLRVAAVVGDDISSDLDRALGPEPRDMFSGEAIPDGVIAANAYFGARPIATALAAGADVVVTGRCADAAVVLGPLMHEFGWGDEDADRLAAGMLIGHIVECGPQCTGGNFTDWWEVPGWDDIGYPIAECRPDGTATITKPAGTGGRVTPASVGEQIVYEIGDPGAYVAPDVICDWRQVRLEQEGPDRVRVEGARGRPATDSYKSTLSVASGYRAITTALITGVDAGAKARRAGEAIVARAARIAGEEGYGQFTETSVEVIGAGEAMPGAGHDGAATEAVVKIGVRHEDAAAVKLFAAEYAPMGLVAQGLTGMFAGRPRIAPVIELYSALASKEAVRPQLIMAGEARELEVFAGEAGAVTSTPPLPEPTGSAGARRQSLAAATVPLHRIALARSGDKGNAANIGLIARSPELTRVLVEQVTAERVRRHFADYLSPRSTVTRWELPGLNAINILISEVLGGTGGTSTLRFDPQGKSYAAMLLAIEVELDGDLADLSGVVSTVESVAVDA